MTINERKQLGFKLHQVSEAEAMTRKSVVLYLFLSLRLYLGSEAGGLKVSYEH